MAKKQLYFEERVALARKALNEKTFKFMSALPTEELRHEFKQFVLDVMNVLDGDFFGDARKRLKDEYNGKDT